MSLHMIVGIVGSLILVTGSAWPAHKVMHPLRSPKNWLFAIGNTCMFLYAYLNFLQGGMIFFIFLQMLVAVSTVLMMLDTNDVLDACVLSLAGSCLVVWSLYLFRGGETMLFVVGLVVLGVGFAVKTGTALRNLFLMMGSICIAVFSVLAQDWIFVGLNVFFALFSGYYAWKLGTWKKK